MDWKIDKDPGGATFHLSVGLAKTPFSHHVAGLSRQQAAELGSAILAIEDKARFNALKAVRDAL